MKKVLFSLLAVTFLLTSCGPDAAKFNDAIVEEQTTMVTDLQNYMNKLNQVSPGNLGDMKTLGDSLLVKIDKSIEVIKGMNTPSGGETFKDAAIAYFESAKKIASVGDKAASLGEEPSETDITAYYKEIGNIGKEITEKENAFLAAQKEFAEEKGMKLR